MKIEISIPDDGFLEAALLANRLDITIRELFCRAVSDYVKSCEVEAQGSYTADDPVRESLDAVYLRGDSGVDDVLAKMQWASLPVDRPRKGPTRDNPYPYCLCNCGNENNPGSRFNKGHDPRVISNLDKVERGEQSADDLPGVLIEAAGRNPKLTVGKYTADDILRLADDRADGEGRAGRVSPPAEVDVRVDMRRGEIWRVSPPGPSSSGLGYSGAVLIIQDNGFNRGQISTVIVADVTSNLDMVEVPGNVFLGIGESGLTTDSVVNVSQIITIDKALFTERVGLLPPETMAAIDGGLRLALGL